MYKDIFCIEKRLHISEIKHILPLPNQNGTDNEKVDGK